MCESDCVDVKLVALTALAELSMNPDYRKCMCASGIADVFINSLTCTYPDIHRTALTGLANLISCTTNVKTCKAFLQCDAAKQSLQALITSKCPQVVRECARSLAMILATLKDTVKDDDCLKHCVEQLSAQCQDSQVQQQMKVCTETLGSTQ
jgi:hypothetical protein